MWIRAIYKLPEIRHVYFIVSPQEGDEESGLILKESTRKRECFEQILRSKDRTFPSTAQQWTLALLSESDFLKVIEQHQPREPGSSNQSSHSPEYLELLAINLLKTPSSRTLETPKFLSPIPSEDIIEVFI
jgi:hypothetical protein